VLPPNFYNQGDQAIYSAGDFFIPQERFRAAPYTVNQPTNPDEVPAGIPAIYQSQGGGGGFDPYNTNMSNVRQDYNAFPSRQAGEIYSKTFNPQPFTDQNKLGVRHAQKMYNKASSDLKDPFNRLALTETFGTPNLRPSKEVMDYYGEKILDNQERYRTQGQYVDPYDPRYSSVTEANKFMDNYPDYYGVPSGVPEEGIPGLIKSYMQNSLLGKGVGMVTDFLGRVMPINERAIMENEARGAGIFTDDIGRIVTDDYNTAGGIMAGYNLNQIDAGTFDKRRSTIEKTIANKKAKGLDTTALEERLGLLDDAEEDILGARKKTQQIYKMRADKKAADKKRKKEEKAAEAEAKNTGGGYTGTPGGNTGSGNFANIDNSGKNYGPYSNNNSSSGSSDYSSKGGGASYSGGGGGASYSSSASTGAKDGFGYGLADGGRVYYMDGGLADMLEIYD